MSFSETAKNAVQELDRAIALAASYVVPAGFLPIGEGVSGEFSAMNYGYPTRYVELSGGVRLAYIDVYAGEEGEPEETIIFLHGLGSYLQAWKRNVPELSRRYRCIAIDLPGYGKSSKRHDISLDFYAATLKNFADAVGVETCMLCGHSLGGQIAVLAALRFPKLARSLALLSAAGLEYYTEMERMIIKPFAKLPIPFFKYASPAGVFLAYAANFYQMPEEALFMVRDRILWAHASDYDLYCEAVLQSFLAMGYSPVAPRLSAVKQPTLIIYGANDNFIPNWFMHGGTVRDVARDSARAIPNARYEIFEKCGHFVPFERPRETNEALRRFIESYQTA
jgi:pimeloyl-ACP methyl ester carboxylesterase